MKSTVRIALVSTLVALGANLAVAQTEPMIQPQSYGDITVVNAGASAEEVDALKRISSQYPLRVVLSNPSGEYVVARTMTVKSDGRTVAEISDAGPWLLMDLPAGRYTLEGDFEGQTFSKSVTVSGHGQTTHWVMPRKVQ